MDNATAHHSSAAKLTAQPVSHRSSEFIALTLGGIGVVYGDIGTSPLYAVRQSLVDFGDLSEQAILGALSLIN